MLTLLRLQLLMLVFTHFLWLFIRLRFFTLQPLAETRSLECGFVGADLMMYPCVHLVSHLLTVVASSVRLLIVLDNGRVLQ